MLDSAIKLAEDFNLKTEKEKSNEGAGAAAGKQNASTDDIASLKAMVAQQSKQLNDQSMQIQNLKRGRDGNPKQKESQD
eukprot:3246095-Rhodomonas_salina.1